MTKEIVMIALCAYAITIIFTVWTKRRWRLIKSRKEAIKQMKIHGVGIFLSLSLSLMCLCVCFVFYFCVFHLIIRLFHSIEYAILFLPIRLLASQSVSQPMMLKHLTERQKHNLIEHFFFKEKKADRKKLCGTQLCTHVKQIQKPHTIHTLACSLAHWPKSQPLWQYFVSLFRKRCDDEINTQPNWNFIFTYIHRVYTYTRSESARARRITMKGRYRILIYATLVFLKLVK